MASFYCFLVFLLLNTCFVIILCIGEMGMGRWTIINVKKCTDPDQYVLEFDIDRRKVNRTHESYDVHVCLDKPLDEKYGMRADIYKLCDGGLKFQQSIEDNNACKFVDDNSKSNLEKAANLANIPPVCPLPAGCHTIENFIVNNDDLPKQGAFGETQIQVFITHEGKNISCTTIDLEFN